MVGDTHECGRKKEEKGRCFETEVLAAGSSRQLWPGQAYSSTRLNSAPPACWVLQVAASYHAKPYRK